MSDAARPAPMINSSQVMAAGFAAAVAAFVTSRFGVTGTLLGAAITAMIITGGSAILKAYFETMTGRVRTVPDRFRARRERRLFQVEVRGGAEGWHGSIPGVELVDGSSDGLVFQLGPDVDEQRLLDHARSSGDVVPFGPVHPTLSELFREVVGA